MEKSPVEKKKDSSKTEEEEEGVDRLSHLPPEILHHIFSFLDTKWAVQTSVLSKDWRIFWTSLPDLNFDSNSFKQLFAFVKFVFKVLGRRNRECSVKKFRFYLRATIYKPLLPRIIDYALSYNVQYLILGFGGRAPTHIPPQELVRFQFLKTLELYKCELSQAFAFTTLTALHLENCVFGDSNSNSEGCCDLFASCPNLNNLSLITCYFKGFKIFKITGPQLLNLTIHFLGREFSWMKIGMTWAVEISAPRLKFFSYGGYAPTFCPLISLPSLEHAHIDASSPYSKWKMYLKEQQAKESYRNFFKFLQGLHNARFLTLSNKTIETLTELLPLLEHQSSPFSRPENLKICNRPIPEGLLPLNLAHGNYVSIPDYVMDYLLSGSLGGEDLLRKVIQMLGGL